MTIIDHPKTPEEFFNDYKDFVYQWLRIKKYDTIDAHEFFSSFTQKIIEKNTLDKFDPEKGVLFKTWLGRVLRNHYLTLVEKSSRDKWISIDDALSSKEGEERRSIELESVAPDPLDEIINENAVSQLIRIIDGIDKVRDRVLIKLKHIHPGIDLITLDDDDIAYIEEQGGKNEKEIHAYIKENVKADIGLKEKHISILLDMPIGSVGTNFQRAVSKWLKE